MPPKSHPFCFPLPPAINPPPKRVTNETPVITNCKDDSCTEVNLRIIEKTKLLIIAIIKMAITPYRMALP